MEKLLDKIKNHILASTILLLIIFIVIHLILKLFHIQFRQWIYCFIMLFTIIGVIAGLVQIVKRKNKKVKIVCSIIGIIIAIVSILLWPLWLLIVGTIYQPEHVLERDNQRYVANVDAFFDVTVYYYDYINAFLVGNRVRIEEYYGNGGFDPLGEKHSEKKPLYYYYYDKDGLRIIETNDEFYNKDNKLY